MTATMTDLVFQVAEEVFSALVDGKEGTLQIWAGDPVPFVDPIAAWVDVTSEWTGRALLLTERTTADDLSRALLRMEPSEELVHEDLVDAFGEVANVVGGNLKSIVATRGVLGLPSVGAMPPEPEDATLIEEMRLDWRGRLIVVRIVFVP
jgi:chemotaxis protein CheX